MRRERFGTAKIALIGIIDEEFEAICRLGNYQQHCPTTPYYVRALAADNVYDVVVCRSDGWGNLASGETVADVIENFRPYFIFLVGIGGGIVRKGERHPVRPGDVIIADYLHYSELKKLSGNTMSFRYKPHDHPSHLLRTSFAEPLKSDSNRWIQRIRANPPSPCTPRAKVENLVSGDTLLGDPRSPYQKVVLENYHTANAVDMESIGVGREMFHQRWDPYYNPQFLVVRGISDLVRTNKFGKINPLGVGKLFSFASSGENQATRDSWRVYAAEAAAAFAITVVDDLLVYIGRTVAPVAPRL